MTVAEQIRAVQLALGITPDGVPGPVTWRAIHARVCGEFAKQPRPTQGFTVDPRSAKNISGLVEPLQRTAEAFLERCQAEGLGVKIICGLRTFAEQDALYAKGRTAPGDVVTKAKSGQSWHNFGLAFDIGVFSPAGDYLGDSPNYAAAGRIGESLGLEWGGRWTRMPDAPHFQWRPPWAIGLSDSAVLAELNRTRSRGVRPA